VRKERATAEQFFAWATTLGYVGTSPAAGMTKIKASGEAAPFRTTQEIQAVIARGGLTGSEVRAFWRCVYLDPGEIADLLALVRDRSPYDVSFVLHVIPAYTGMRRGEVMRLRWGDIEFEQNSIVARSRKQSRQSVEARRRIDMHEELKVILLEWRDRRPTGQYVVCDPGSRDPLSSRETTGRFFRPLRGTPWCLCPRRDWFRIGVHTYRHSFASNLAARGVDQRIIDAWLGHQTEAMRRRYRHLFPSDRRAAIACFSLAADGDGKREVGPATA
jgi:integrase